MEDEMKKYTLITEYRNGFYINQYEAENIENVLVLWADRLDKKIFTVLKKKQVKEELADRDIILEDIEGFENVWRTSFLGGKFLIIVFIIETS